MWRGRKPKLKPSDRHSPRYEAPKITGSGKRGELQHGLLYGQEGCAGGGLGAGTLFLVFGTSAPSYVKTAFHKVRQNVKESVDPQFEIDRARQDIENLKPMFDQNKETLARAEVEAENLESEVGTMQANLDKAKQTILAMQHKLKTGDFRLTGHVIDTRG